MLYMDHCLIPHASTEWTANRVPGTLFLTDEALMPRRYPINSWNSRCIIPLTVILSYQTEKLSLERDYFEVPFIFDKYPHILAQQKCIPVFVFQPSVKTFLVAALPGDHCLCLLRQCTQNSSEPNYNLGRTSLRIQPIYVEGELNVRLTVQPVPANKNKKTFSNDAKNTITGRAHCSRITRNPILLPRTFFTFPH